MPKKSKVEGKERVVELLKNSAMNIVESNGLLAIEDLESLIKESDKSKLRITTTQIIEKVGTAYEINTDIKWKREIEYTDSHESVTYDPDNPDLPGISEENED